MKIYASLTTTPSRLGRIDEPLRSILRDKFDGVFLNIPYVSRKNVPYPEDAVNGLVTRMNSEKLIITRVERDYGPLTKLVGSLDRIEPGDFVVVFDDDRIVTRSVYEAFRKEFLNNPGGVYSMGGWIRSSFPTRYKNVIRNRKTTPVDSVMGVTCIGFRRDLVDKDDLISFRKSDSRLDNLDDMRISAYFAKKKIARYSIGADPARHLKDVYLGGGLSANLKFWYLNMQVMDDFHREGLFNVKSSGGTSMEAIVIFTVISLILFGYVIINHRRNPRVMGGLVIAGLLFLVIITNRISYITL